MMPTVLTSTSSMVIVSVSETLRAPTWMASRLKTTVVAIDTAVALTKELGMKRCTTTSMMLMDMACQGISCGRCNTTGMKALMPTTSTAVATTLGARIDCGWRASAKTPSAAATATSARAMNSCKALSL